MRREARRSGHGWRPRVRACRNGYRGVILRGALIPFALAPFAEDHPVVVIVGYGAAFAIAGLAMMLTGVKCEPVARAQSSD